MMKMKRGLALIVALILACSGISVQSAAAEASDAKLVPTLLQNGTAADVTVRIDARDPIEAVNRKVLGTGLMYFPFNESYANAFKPILEGSSGRVWAYRNEDEGHWQDFMPFVKSVGLKEIISVNTQTTHSDSRVRYVSATDNNLYPNQQPQFYASQLQLLNKQAHPGFPDGYGITGWEVWNEPEFPQNGKWPAEDYARFVLDVSKALRAVDPKIEIGAAMSYDDNQWNENMLRYVAKINPDAIDFAVIHPYEFRWNDFKAEGKRFEGIMQGADRMREFIRPKKDILWKYGHGRWRIAATEWNVHPSDFNQPTTESRDLASALHAAGFIQTMWEEGVDSANYFLLRSDKWDDHFSLAADDAAGNPVFRPAYYVFRMYADYFTGMRMNTTVEGPTFVSPPVSASEKPVNIPFVTVQSAYDETKDQMTVTLLNRNKTDSEGVSLTLDNFELYDSVIRGTTLTGNGPEAENPIVNEFTLNSAAYGSSNLAVTLPAHSFTTLRFKGSALKIPQDTELEAANFEMVKDWKVLGPFNKPDNATNHGLDVVLPGETERDENSSYPGVNGQVAWKTVAGQSSTGYVNVGDLPGGYTEQSQALAVTQIWSPSKAVRQISFGSDYWAKVYVNGVLTLDRSNRGGPPSSDEVRYPIQLEGGWNDIAVRLSSGSKGSGFWFGLDNRGYWYPSASVKKPSFTPNPPAELSLPAFTGTYVDNGPGLGTQNFASSKLLHVKKDGGNEQLSYVGWDLSGLSSSLQLVNAEIVMNRVQASGTAGVRLFGVNGAWETGSVTYASKPQLTQASLATGTEADKSVRFSGDAVKTLVAGWLAHPDQNHGIALSAVGGESVFSNWNAADGYPTLRLSFEVPPTWPKGSKLTAGDEDKTSVTLSWTPAVDNTAVTGYRIYRGQSQVAELSASSTTYTVTGLEPGTLHTFRVEAGDTADTWSNDGPSVSVRTMDANTVKADIKADQGTYSHSYPGYQNTPFDSRLSIELSGNSGGERVGYVKWDLSSIPKGSQVYKAELVLTKSYVNQVNEVTVHPILEDWQESTLLYTNKPAIDRSNIIGKMDTAPATWKVTGEALRQLTESWVADPSSNRGLAFATSDLGYVGFDSDDHSTQQPRLIVHYVPASADASLPAAEASYTNAFGQLQNENFGSAEVIELSEDASSRRVAFTKWNLSTVQAGSSIESAELVFHVNYSVNVDRVKLHVPKSAWQENTLTYANQPELSDPLIVESISADTIRFSGAQVNALVRSWAADPANNLGVVLTAGNDGYLGIASNNASTNQPMLILRLAKS